MPSHNWASGSSADSLSQAARRPRIPVSSSVASGNERGPRGSRRTPSGPASSRRAAISTRLAPSPGSSGRTWLNGPTALRNKAGETRVTPGTYRVRHHSTGLDTISEEALNGNDHYRILLWPDETYREPQTLKT
jgi:hypothetical protein